MKSKIPFFGIGQKTQQRHSRSPLLRQKKQNFLDLTEKGKSDDIAHRSIIHVSTVFGGLTCFITSCHTLHRAGVLES